MIDEDIKAIEKGKVMSEDVGCFMSVPHPQN